MSLKKFSSKQTIFVVIPLTILVLIGITIYPYKLALVMEYQNTGRILAYLPLERTEPIQLKYTHSIHLSNVVESYRITEEHYIKQYELMYEDFGIGMPANSEVGEVFERKDGKYFIKNMKRIFPHFDLRVGKVKANHTIIYKKKEYPLSKVITPGTWIHIKVKEISLFQRMKGVDILEYFE